MKTVSKFCKTLDEAVHYQNALYDQFNHVQLVQFPRFSEEGRYVWTVGA